MSLPRPGETRIRNLVATMILSGNSAHQLNLPRIAYHQGFDPGELSAEFARQETAMSLQPKNTYDVEGK
jgi:hypothetical protein